MPSEGFPLRLVVRTASLVLSTAAIWGCSSEEAANPAPGPAPSPPREGPAPFQELYDQGLDRYVGMVPPTGAEILPDGVVSHSFEGEDGPVCFTGSPFTMSTRDGAGDALMVFVQGGGACGPNHCDAVESWPPGIPSLVAGRGVLNAADPGNPAADYDVAYLPYCDGSLWSGDSDVDDDGDGTIDYRFRGLMNLTASIDVIAATYPAPRTILLIGNSAGGFGVHQALPLLRIHYPSVPIEMVNDSGIGISLPGRWEQTNDYWNAASSYPDSCADCIGEDGNLTGYHRYQLDQDPHLRMGMMSTKQDAVVLEGLPMEPADFEAELLVAVAELEEAHPNRFRSFIADGDGHTFVLRDFDREVGGATPRSWLTSMLEGGEWSSVAD